MTKPALGRSLGNLLGGSHKNASPEGNVASGSDNDQLDLTSVTPGLGTLLRGSGTPRDELPLDTPPAPEPASDGLFERHALPSGSVPAREQSQPGAHPATPPVLIGLVQLTLLAADVMLMVLAWMLMRVQALSGFWMVLFCLVASGLGAWLSCLAVLLEPERPSENAAQPRKK